MPVKVKDRFGAAADIALPSLRLALDPEEVKRTFRKGLPRLAGPGGVVRVRRIRVERHKPGRRAVVEYDVRVERPDATREAVTLVGKVRSGRSGKLVHALLDSLWAEGFGVDSPDGVHVPEPVAALSRFRMSLQRKAPGRPASELLAPSDGAVLGRRVAEAAHKLHRARVPVDRRHTMADELRILRDCLCSVAAEEPRWERRVQRILRASERLGAATPEPVPCTVHRDFYADHVIVDGARLYLIDFDLYCWGDPGLDVGNFLGHVTEQSLRTAGDPAAFATVEQEIEERFVELSGEAVRAAVRAYATLTLARHVYLSRQLRKRRHLSEELIELCEERLAATPGWASARRRKPAHRS